jgi:hypothetical protein
LSWGQNSLGFCAAAAALSLAAPAAANVLVVRSSGPSAGSYRPGASLPDNARITLRTGDTVVVLGAGGTRTYRGPGNFTAASNASGAAVAAASDGRRARIGAVRTGGIVPHGPTIWHVDVNQGGTFCLAGNTSILELWRPDASETIALSVAGPGGAPRSVRWPAGQTTLELPVGGPVANGASYTFSQPGVAVPTRITFRTLAQEPTDLEEVAEGLIANGCQDQLDVLIESQPASGG